MERPIRVALLVVSAIAVSYILEQTRVNNNQQPVAKNQQPVADNKKVVPVSVEEDVVVVVSEEPTATKIGELLVNSMVVAEAVPSNNVGNGNDEDLVREIVNEAIAQAAQEEEKTECFSEKFKLHPQDDNGEEEVEIFFFILPLDQSCFVWCGADSTELASLVVAMNPPRNNLATTTATGVLGNNSDQDLASAARLARKSNQVVHFASSLSKVEAAHPEIRLLIEKAILTRI